MSKVVIVCFTFPPFPGIGGRRWAKFARCLHDAGHEIQVIAAKKQSNEPSAWTKDTLNYSNKIHFIPSGFPHVLASNPQTIVQKIAYRAALLWVKLRNFNGNYFDHSAFFGHSAAKEIEKCIALGYNNVIVSCGPFRMTEQILKLKQKYPQVRFILDFRDPWTNNKTAFSFQTISKNRLQFEQKLEKWSVDTADYVMSVSSEMNDYFQKISGANHQKFIELPNGFDHQDFNQSVTLQENKANTTDIVFAGTLYNNTEHIFKQFSDNLLHLKAQNKCSKNVKYKFYGYVPNWFRKYAEQHNGTIEYGGNLSLNEAFGKLKNAAAFMLFLTDDLSYSKSTKFYEYVAMKKPILVFSIGGETGNYIQNNKLGFDCNENEMLQNLELAIHKIETGTVELNDEYNIEEHDVSSLTNQILQILQ